MNEYVLFPFIFDVNSSFYAIWLLKIIKLNQYFSFDERAMFYLVPHTCVTKLHKTIDNQFDKNSL